MGGMLCDGRPDLAPACDGLRRLHLHLYMYYMYYYFPISPSLTPPKVRVVVHILAFVTPLALTVQPTTAHFLPFAITLSFGLAVLMVLVVLVVLAVLAVLVVLVVLVLVLVVLVLVLRVATHLLLVALLVLVLVALLRQRTIVGMDTTSGTAKAHARRRPHQR